MDSRRPTSSEKQGALVLSQRRSGAQGATGTGQWSMTLVLGTPAMLMWLFALVVADKQTASMWLFFPQFWQSFVHAQQVLQGWLVFLQMSHLSECDEVD